MAYADLKNFPLRTIDHQGDFGNFGFVCNEIQKGAHGGSAIEHAFVHVHVDHIGTTVDLRFRDANRIFEFAFFDEPSKFLGSRDVGAFADHDERVVLSKDERLVARVLGWSISCLSLPRLDASHGFADGFDVGRGTSAATANNIDPTLSREVANEACHFRRSFVELSHFVGQARIRIAADRGVRNTC